MERAEQIATLGLTVESKFVPFSQSRNKGEKSPSLNWLITLKRNGREVLTCDYSAGMGHCPCYPKLKGPKTTVYNDNIIRNECESGRSQHVAGGKILPDSASVIYSLFMDSGVLNSGGFEEWASEYGYDTDSRSAESIYRACLEIALKLRAAIGESGLETLATVFEDY